MCRRKNEDAPGREVDTRLGNNVLQVEEHAADGAAKNLGGDEPVAAVHRQPQRPRCIIVQTGSSCGEVKLEDVREINVPLLIKGERTRVRILIVRRVCRKKTGRAPESEGVAS